MSMTSYDPTFSQYQVDPRFPSDKEATWKYPKEDDGWIMSHNALRGEVVCMKEAMCKVIERGLLEAWEVLALQCMWQSHYEHIDGHHHSEDDKFQPKFEERFTFPEQDAPGHDIILDHLNRLKDLFGDLTVDKAKMQILIIQDSLYAYERDLLPHLLWEEEKLLPLMRAYFSQAEMSKIVQEIVMKEPPHSMGSFIHFQTEKRFRAVFMKQEGIPSFVWYLAFSGQYRAFREKFLIHYEALANGVVPVPSTRQFLFSW